MAIKMESISKQMLHNSLSSVLDKVYQKQTPTLVTNNNEPAVVLFPYKIYQQWTDARERRLHQAFENLQVWVSEYTDNLTGLDAVQLVRESRTNL